MPLKSDPGCQIFDFICELPKSRTQRRGDTEKNYLLVLERKRQGRLILVKMKYGLDRRRLRILSPRLCGRYEANLAVAGDGVR